jgi:hypothetical protein
MCLSKGFDYRNIIYRSYFKKNPAWNNVTFLKHNKISLLHFVLVFLTVSSPELVVVQSPLNYRCPSYFPSPYKLVILHFCGNFLASLITLKILSKF